MIFSCQLRQQNSWFCPKLKTRRNIFRAVYFCSSYQIFPVALSSTAAVSQSNWRPNQTCQIRLEPELYICPQSGQMLNWTLATDADTQHNPPQLSISFVGLLSKVNILHKKYSVIESALSPRADDHVNEKVWTNISEPRVWWDSERRLGAVITRKNGNCDTDCHTRRRHIDCKSLRLPIKYSIENT